MDVGRKRLTGFFAVLILFNLTCSFAHPVTPTVMIERNLPDYMFGVAYAMMTCGNFLLSPFWGKLNEYISSRRSLLISCVGYGLAQIWFAYAQTELSVSLARFIAGIFIGGAFVSVLTYVVNVAAKEDQPRFLTYCATINCVCGAFGYLIGGLVGEYSVRASFWLQAVTLILCGILFYAACEGDAKRTDRIEIKELAKEANPLKAFLDCGSFMTKAYLCLFAVSALVSFAYVGFDQAFNYYLKDQLQLTSSYNGIIKSVVGLVSFVANMTLCIWMMKKTNVGKSMAVLLGAAVAFSTGILIWSDMIPFMIMSLMIYGIYSVSQPVLQNMVVKEAKEAQKNLVVGFFNGIKNFGSIAGSLIAGFTYSLHSMLPFACTILVFAAACAVTVAYLKYDRQM